MDLFFELLQVSLGRREGLSREPSAVEWEAVYEEAEKQGVTGVMLDLRKNRRLQRWFKEHEALVQGSLQSKAAEPSAGFKVHGGEITTPTVEFNLFYILLHIYRHFLHTGIGMRQVTDYYMVLRTAKLKGLPLSSLIETVRTFGMERFARGLMWVMKETMAVEEDACLR